MLALGIHVYARVIHTNFVFFPSLPSPTRSFSQNFPLCWTKTFTYNSLFDKEITPSVKEVKDKNTFCKETRACAWGFSIPESICRPPLLPTKSLPTFSVMICCLLKNFYWTAICEIQSFWGTWPVFLSWKGCSEKLLPFLWKKHRKIEFV